MTPSQPVSLRKQLARFPKARVLVIGDIVVDHFIWGSVSRISPEAPVPVVNVTRENLLLGGAANVLHNLYDMGGQAVLCGVIGNDMMGGKLLELLGELNSPTDGIFKAADRPTTKKTRIVAQSQQVVRFDREQSGDIPAESLEQITAYLDGNLAGFDAVVVSDYDKGVIGADLMDHLRRSLEKNGGIPLVVDPKPSRTERFRGATIMTPNNHEAELMSGMKITDEESLLAAAAQLQSQLQTEAMLITRGEAGMALFEKDKPLYTIPTVAREVFDVTGAGDTVVATLALGLAAGLNFIDAATIANMAAGIVVGKVGTATASTAELEKALS